MRHSLINLKSIRVIYGVIFPAIVITLLLYYASSNTDRRTLVLGSTTSDFIIRLFITIWFCALYIRLSRFSNYRTYPNKAWTKEDTGIFEKVLLNWINNGF